MGPQHSQSLESWFMHIPGLRVAIPSNARDALGLMRTALRDPNPVLFVENVRLYGRRGEVDLDEPPIPFGSARVAREGDDVTVVALSGMVDEALRAADDLAGRGIGVEVVDPRTIAPLDVDAIVRSLRKTRRVVVTHDAHKTAGVGAEIAALCMEHGFDHLDAPVARVAGLDVPIPCGPVLAEVYPSAATLAAAVEELVRRPVRA
jgi:pyruvate dehydrogenase E1 component beta subunit